jgi:hypothetical protein
MLTVCLTREVTLFGWFAQNAEHRKTFELHVMNPIAGQSLSTIPQCLVASGKLAANINRNLLLHEIAIAIYHQDLYRRAGQLFDRYCL